MDALDLLTQRRSSRAAELTAPGPEGAALQRILEAAIRVPDHGKLGPWRLLVLQGADRAWAGARLAERFKALNPDASDALVTLEAERFLRRRWWWRWLIAPSPVKRFLPGSSSFPPEPCARTCCWRLTRRALRDSG